MISRTNGATYADPAPARIGASEWHRLFREIPEEFIAEYRYFRSEGKAGWNTYLFPPSSYIMYGSRYLRKLKFDNSLAALRLWGFMINESERLYRARQSGRKIVATMGDLGSIPPLVWSFPDLVPFYPDCYWWTPFLNESGVLFDEAERQGIGENCCFVRAALGAFAKLAYFPRPDLNIGSTGASCDDMAAVLQRTAQLGHVIHWFEIPHRKRPEAWYTAEDFESTFSHGVTYQESAKRLIEEEFSHLVPALEKTAGEKFDLDRLKKAIRKTNEMRRIIAEIKDLAFSAERAPLPALEIMNIEFMALSAYSDIDEAATVLRHVLDTVRERVEQGAGVLPPDSLRIVWVTPPADPLLLNYMEDLGGRLAGTEFVINQSLYPLREDGGIGALADGMLNGSLMGTAESRAREILTTVEKYRAEGVIVSNIFASSHCASETGVIRELIRAEAGIPVLVFDVVAPGKERMQSQILNRMTAFMELLKARRRNGNGR